jgi:hypothetical protein
MYMLRATPTSMNLGGSDGGVTVTAEKGGCAAAASILRN